jgi:serine/threonine protein kinase
VTVYEAGRFRGRLFMAMEFVQGELLEKFVHTGTPLPLTRVFEIAGQVAGALEALHAAGMVQPRSQAVEHHPDLTPTR